MAHPGGLVLAEALEEGHLDGVPLVPRHRLQDLQRGEGGGEKSVGEGRQENRSALACQGGHRDAENTRLCDSTGP